MAFTAAQKKEHIRELQRFLHAIAYYNRRIPIIIPDGFYGKETAIAVRAFQREYGLPETGNTDLQTWNKIVSVFRSFVYAQPSAYNIFPSESFVLGEGDSGLLVFILQAMLNDLGERFDNMPHISVSGQYGKETANAVRAFQRNVNLPQNGRVNSATWNLLTKTSEHANKT